MSKVISYLRVRRQNVRMEVLPNPMWVVLTFTYWRGHDVCVAFDSLWSQAQVCDRQSLFGRSLFRWARVSLGDISLGDLISLGDFLLSDLESLWMTSRWATSSLWVTSRWVTSSLFGMTSRWVTSSLWVTSHWATSSLFGWPLVERPPLFGWPLPGLDSFWLLGCQLCHDVSWVSLYLT